MNRTAALLLAAGCTGLGPVAACSALGGGAGNGAWTNAQPITVVAAEDAFLNSNQPIWCGSPRDCTLVYPDASQVWAVSETNANWRAPTPIPGMTGANLGPDLSCAGPGECVAASLSARPGFWGVLVASQVRGIWGDARIVPGLAALTGRGASNVAALSCGAGDWCAIAGEYGSLDSVPNGGAGHPATPFVATLHDGTWRNAQRIPGLARLNAKGWTSRISVLSCGSGGACTAAGTYRDRSSGLILPFVVSSRNGIWGQAHPMGSSITRIACTTPGNCAAAGYGPSQPYVVTEQNGAWSRPEALPGVNLGSKFVAAEITNLQCTAPGDCLLAGFYGASDPNTCGGEYYYCYQGYYSVTVPFVASQVNGTWLAARELPGLATLDRGGIAVIASVSCGSPGNCAAGGFTAGLGESAPVRVFVISEANGAWNRAERVPGLEVLHSANSEVDFIFCARAPGPAPGCVAVGRYGRKAHVGARLRWHWHLFATWKPGAGS